MAAQRDKYLLAYLACFASTDNCYFGGVLITDENGMPREFRHTDAIRPTRLQQILYGDQLESALGTHAIGPALIAALNRQPTLFLIDKAGRAMFGDLLLAQGPCALLATANTDEEVFMESVGPSGMMLDAIRLRMGDTGQHIYAYVDWTGTGADPRKALDECQNTMNLYSPFERVRTVLSHITQTESAKRK